MCEQQLAPCVQSPPDGLVCTVVRVGPERRPADDVLAGRGESHLHLGATEVEHQGDWAGRLIDRRRRRAAGGLAEGPRVAHAPPKPVAATERTKYR